ncbi:YeeE/YedE thiosulfate transporter family protein [Zunongwangia sp. F363]|uniref:YeeE/YedE thiosulfate transporter family protein n=1 Tax=Autumnicola tepida TaxID=3075595 RepID=A0ABU3CCA3_9FLAO|nr:YeeE/YedE thiosulfate transporter family protein [Zunongwangia sp. F363]MDT0643951.1 YeeE/YedE thiosulfate transporter family protein [Zunongwangia sp. F363]
MEWIYEPWPWYVAGPLIAAVMFLLLLMGRQFGMSSNLRTMCTMCGADAKADFFKFDWKAQRWNLLVVIGAAVGGFIAANFLTRDPAVNINPETVQNLQNLGFQSAGAAYLPDELFSLDALMNIKSLAVLLVGGILIGFGARYAGGCTSGHAISGLSNLQLPSLIAVAGFFIGGMVMIYLIFPLIF